MPKKKKKSKKQEKPDTSSTSNLKLPYKTKPTNPYLRPPILPRRFRDRIQEPWTFDKPRPPRIPPTPRESTTISKSFKEHQNVGVSTWRRQPTANSLRPGPRKNYHFSIPKSSEYSTSVTSLQPSRVFDVIRGSGGKRFVCSTDPTTETFNRETHRRMNHYRQHGSNYKKPTKKNVRFARRSRYSSSTQKKNRKRNQRRDGRDYSSSRKEHAKKKRKKSTKSKEKEKSSTPDNRISKEEFEKRQQELADIEYSQEDYRQEGETGDVVESEEPGEIDDLVKPEVSVFFLVWFFCFFLFCLSAFFGGALFFLLELSSSLGFSVGLGTFVSVCGFFSFVF